MPENNANDEQVFERFITEMIEEKSILIGKEAKQPSREELAARLDSVIQRTTLECLPLEKLGELSEMMEHDVSDDELEKFFDEAGVDYQQALALSFEAFRQEYLSEGLPDTNTSTTTEENTLSNDIVGQPAMGEPVQGTTSEVPGASDVEGASNATLTEEEE